MIQRWKSYDKSYILPNSEGDFVAFNDHEAALAAEKEKVRELVEALKSMTFYAGLNERDGFWDDEDEDCQEQSKACKDAEALIEKYSKEEPNGS